MSDLKPSGIYPHTTDDEYFAEPRLSNSRCTTLLTSTPDQFLWEWEHPDEVDENRGKGITVGTQLHELMLDPVAWEQKYARGPTGDGRTKKYKEEWAQIEEAGKVPVDGDEYDAALRIRDAILAHPKLGPIVSMSERVHREVMLCWDEEHHGMTVPWKAKVDLDVPYLDLFFDWKFVLSPDKGPFRRAMFNYGWHRQILAYETGADVLGQPRIGGLVAIQKARPHRIAIWYPSEWYRDIARRDLDKAIAIFTECWQSGVWPSFSPDPQPIDPEMWMDRE